LKTNLKNGFTRISLVLSIAWFLFVICVAYSEYNSISNFKDEYGLGIGMMRNHTFWVAQENIFNQFDPPNAPLSPYKATPNYLAFGAYVVIPISLLWLFFWCVGWVYAGFRKNA
jgi:hypothetical protein